MLKSTLDTFKADFSFIAFTDRTIYKNGNFCIENNLPSQVDNNKLMFSHSWSRNIKVKPYIVSMSIRIILQQQIIRARTLVSIYAMKISSLEICRK